MSNFSANDKTIGDFFSKYQTKPEKSLYIPDLQREYTWGVEQFQELWDDLTTQYDGTFFGSILVKDDNDQFDEVAIIDGQQRITTITILVQSICFFLERLKFSEFFKDNPAQLIREIQKLQNLYVDRYEIETQSDGTSKVTNNFYLNVQDVIDPYFKKYVQTPQDPNVYDELDPNLNKRPYRKMIHEFLDITSAQPTHRPHFNKGRSCKRMQVAYKFFMNKFEESDSYQSISSENTETYREFLAFLNGLILKLNNLQIVHIQAPEEDLAYEYFEAVNARGISLSVADLLKNLILKNISSKRKLKKAKENWDDFIESIREFDKRENAIGDFFRYYWASEYEYVASKHLYKAIKSKKISELGDSDDEWLSYTVELQKTAKAYRLLLDPNKKAADFIDYGFNVNVANSISDSIFGLRASKSRIWTVIFLSLINNNLDKNNFNYFKNSANGFDFKKFSDILSRFIFSYSYIVKDRSNRVWSTFCDLAIKLNNAAANNDDIETLEDIFKESFYEKIKQMIPKEEIFKEECVDNLRYLPNFSAPVKYVLWEIEKNIYDNKDFTRSGTTIEHIVPRDPEEHWGFKLDQCKEIDTIGNLVLLEKRPNSRLQNYNFSKKIEKLIERPSDINQITGDDNQNVKGLLKYIGNPVTSAEINFPDFKDVKLVSGSVNIEPIIDRQEFVLNQIFEVFVNQVNQKISGYLR